MSYLSPFYLGTDDFFNSVIGLHTRTNSGIRYEEDDEQNSIYSMDMPGADS